MTAARVRTFANGTATRYAHLDHHAFTRVAFGEFLAGHQESGRWFTPRGTYRKSLTAWDSFNAAVPPGKREKGVALSRRSTPTGCGDWIDRGFH
jgi:hypothetical protein